MGRKMNLENVIDAGLKGIVYSVRLVTAPFLFPFGVYYNYKGSPYAETDVDLCTAFVETAKSLSLKELYKGVPEDVRALRKKLIG